jgi:hypothetical protein
MEKKQKLFLGFTVMMIMVIFTMVGCDLNQDEFPSEIRGTWERAFQSSYTNTLTITSAAFKSSNQSFYWVLVGVSGDTYTLEQSDNRNHSVTEVIKLVNGNLEIDEGGDAGTGPDNWNGTWKKR